LVRARIEELERLQPGRGGLGADFWDSRARRFAVAVAGTAERDPFLAHLRRVARRGSSVLDVGAGSGRFSLALAPRVRRVIAVDPSEAMLRILRREAGRRGFDNIETILGRWQEVEAGPADVGICSYVIPFIPDAPAFLRKLDAASRERAFVYMSGISADPIDHLWRYFHGRPRRPGPTYLDLAAVLEESGVSPEVAVVEVPTISRFRSLDAAVRSYRDTLLLPDTREVRRELRALLRAWLVPRGEGLAPPFSTMPGAIVSWRPTHWNRTRRR
jgi:SAM-dependent methyltransferase